MADNGAFFVDTRSPHISTDIAAVTIGATNKTLIPLANQPILGANYFGWVGKMVRIRIWGRWSTAATPGTQTFTLLWGSGLDNTGTAIVTSQVVTPIASLVNTSWRFEGIVRCRTMGATGTLFGHGTFEFLNSLTLTTAAVEFLMPATAPAASASLDLTAANVISFQALATTSTTNTMQVHDYIFEAMN